MIITLDTHSKTIDMANATSAAARWTRLNETHRFTAVSTLAVRCMR